MTLLAHIAAALSAVEPRHCELSRLTYSSAVEVPAVAKYLERPFAYELYHQLRLRMISTSPGWTAQLQGEVDKRYQGVMRVPDFLIHRPSSNEANLAAIEVKLAERGWGALAADLGKLALFGQPPLRYAHLVEIVFGTGASLSRLRDQLPILAAPGGEPITVFWYDTTTREVLLDGIRVLPLTYP